MSYEPGHTVLYDVKVESIYRENYWWVQSTSIASRLRRIEKQRAAIEHLYRSAVCRV